MQTAPSLLAAALQASKPAGAHATPPSGGFIILETPTLADAAIDPDEAAQVAREAAEAEARRVARNRTKNEARRRRRAGEAAVVDQAEQLVDRRARRVAREAAAKAAWIEDVDWMARSGETTVGAAGRMGLSVKAFQKRLSDTNRYNRPDLWARLRANEQRPEATVTFDGQVAGGVLRGVAC